MTNGRGVSGIRHAVVAGLAALVLSGSDALAARNCVSNTGRGRSAKVKTLKVVGLTADGRLLCFNAKGANDAEVVGAVTGLQAQDTALVGIDFRVQDGLLYGVGNGGGVYTIDSTSAQATFVNALSVPLDPAATAFGVDFNPAADRLRIIADTGQNLRHNVNTGGTTIADAPLTIMMGTSVVPGTGVTGAAYTNNDVPPAGMATGTTLFDLDPMRNQIVVQSPPNGIPGAVAPNLVPTGALGTDGDQNAGFDVYTATVDGVAVSNQGYAALTIASGQTGFYTVDLLTGAATFEDAFADVVVDVALPVNQN